MGKVLTRTPYEEGAHEEGAHEDALIAARDVKCLLGSRPQGARDQSLRVRLSLEAQRREDHVSGAAAELVEEVAIDLQREERCSRWLAGHLGKAGAHLPVTCWPPSTFLIWAWTHVEEHVEQIVNRNARGAHWLLRRAATVAEDEVVPVTTSI